MQFRHVYMNFRQNFRQKKKKFAISEKTLAETVNCIPKGLRKGNPFQGPFAQLSYISTQLLLAWLSLNFTIKPYPKNWSEEVQPCLKNYNSENHESWKQVPFHKNKDTLVFQIHSQKVFWVGFGVQIPPQKVFGYRKRSLDIGIYLGCGPLPSNSDHKDYFIFSRESL